MTHGYTLATEMSMQLCVDIRNPTFRYSTTLMQCRTRTTLFLDSTGLLERSTFTILEKIARVANDTRSRWFREYRLLDRLLLAMANRVTMEATLPFYQTV